MFRKLLTAAALTALSALSIAAAALPVQAAETYNVDPGHSEVSFQVRHLVTQVRGKFNDYKGTIQLDPAKLESSTVELAIKTASIDTGAADRDKHLRTADFFDAEKFPEITFKSKSIKATGKDQYAVTGTFTMHGVSKDITLPVALNGFAKDPWGGQRAGFSTETTINRKDYGIVWNKAIDNGGALLGDDVKIAVSLEAVKAKEPAKPAK
jgi:polyisoprenoid-binding protein YceI